ncbi:hypothetical protein E2320_021239, partial [Naja naja]
MDENWGERASFFPPLPLRSADACFPRTSLWKAFERTLCFLPTKTMMSVEGSTITSRIKNLLRSPSIKLRRSKPGTKRENISTKA